MKSKLKKITNLTLNQLLSNEIILPSSYFEEFNKNAQSEEVNLDDENFKEKINELISSEFTTIENYMQLLMTNLNSLEKNTKLSKEAIINKDLDTLNKVYTQIENLQKEIKNLNEKIYFDEIPNIYNKKWIYNKYLENQTTFKNNIHLVSINIFEYNYISKEYGELIADNLLTYIVSYLNKKLNDAFDDFFIARIFENKFLIFVENSNKNDVEHEIFNQHKILSTTTLKSKSGLLINANFNYKTIEITKSQNISEVLEALFT